MAFATTKTGLDARFSPTQGIGGRSASYIPLAFMADFGTQISADACTA
jgi:hypothetical protein